MTDFVKFTSNLTIFQSHLVSFEILYQLIIISVSMSSILPSGNPLGGPPGLKTNYLVNLSNFPTTRRILILKLSMDRAREDHKLCLRG